MPIDSTTIDSVCVDFDRLTVHYAGQDDVVLDYSPLASQVTSATHCTDTVWNGVPPVPAIRLDALGGPLTVALAESLQIPVGRVTWIRLHFTGGSYILDDIGGQHDLRCPSCDVTDNNDGRGFKLNRTFEITSDGIALMVDIDLSKSLHQDANGYVLRPTARVEVNDTLGTIAGDVYEALIADLGGVEFMGTDVDTGCAVYIYTGHDAPTDDYYDTSPDTSPIVSIARVRFSVGSGTYSYAAGALPGGTAAAPEPYTAALSCDMDDPLMNNTDMEVAFTAGQNADVIAGETETVDFLP
jgi:hypothetical protein